MRHLASTFMLIGALALPSLALAQDAKPQPPLPEWNKLTPAQRELLIAPIRERWNNEPERRDQFMDYAKRWKSMPEPRREHARRGMERWEEMSPEQREQARAVFHATRSMDKDARRAFMEKWRAMTPQQRTDWIKAHTAAAEAKN